ncbi:hypothetical protein [Alcanivorax sp.]|uniref:hypothetical protein n=1 Tax=Alcanivorax sp. TaxID=1872427 RepID=UPI0025C67AAC|nr:hypothetical protein [Alcanivorax sp.]
MKKLFALFILLFTFIPALSYAEIKNECGEIKASSNEGYLDRCNQDALNDTVNYLFPNVVKFITLGNEETSDAKLEALKQTPTARIIDTAVTKFNIYSFSISAFILFVAGLVALFKSTNTGNVSFIAKSVATIAIIGILTFPFSAFKNYSLAQVAVISVAKSSISASTFLVRKYIDFRNFDLNKIDVSTTKISQSTRIKGQQLSQMALCGVRTERAKQQNYFTLLDENPLSTGKKYWNKGLSVGSSITGVGDIDDHITTYDFANVQKQLNGCYGNKYKATKKDHEITFLSYGGIDSCHFGDSTVDYEDGEEKIDYGFNEEKMGYGYECGAIYYADTEVDYIDSESSGIKDGKFDEVKEQIESDELAIVSTFNTLNFSLKVMKEVEKVVEESSSNNLSEDETLEKLNSVATTLTNDLLYKSKQLGKKYESKLQSTVSSQRTNLLNIYYTQLHKKAMKAMLGGFTPGNFYEDEKSNNNNIKHILNNYALETAKYLNAASCYKNVDDYRLISNFNLADLKNDEESIQKLQKDFGTNTFECLNVDMYKAGDINVDLVGTALDMPPELATIRAYFDENTQLFKNYQAQQKSAVDHLNKKARHYQSALNGYLYVIERATADSLSQTFKRIVDKDSLTALSKKGVLGLLTLSNANNAYSSNASQKIDSLSEIFAVDNGSNNSSMNYLTNQADNYIALQAFADEDLPYQAIESQIADKSFNFNYINTDSFYSQKNNYSVGDEASFEKTKRQNDDIETSDFHKAFAELANSPTTPFRKIVGAAKGQSLNERVSECIDQDLDFLCLKNDSDVMVALNEFGQRGVTASISIAFLEQGSNALGGNNDYDGGKNKKKKGWKSYIIKGLGIAVLAVSEVAKAIISVAAQINPMILMVSIFLGYVVPFIPIMKFFVELIMYTILLLVSVFTIPLTMIFGAFRNELDLKPVFNTFITLFLHIPLITTIYIAGLTLLGGLFWLLLVSAQGMTNSNSGIINLLMDNLIMFTFLGVMMFFIVLKVFDFSFWTNHIYKQFGLQGINFTNDSMAFERLMQTGAIHNVVTSATNFGGGIVNKVTHKAAVRPYRNFLDRKRKKEETEDSTLNKIAEATAKKEEKKED